MTPRFASGPSVRRNGTSRDGTCGERGGNGDGAKRRHSHVQPDSAMTATSTKTDTAGLTASPRVFGAVATMAVTTESLFSNLGARRE
jgi:hypothetical protein